ncbi:MAG: SDR family oxidoreductase [Pseudomonadota bacterium]
MERVVISGANRGIGLGLVEAFSARGDHVLAACRTPDSAAELRALADHPNRTIEIVALDVTNPDSVAALPGSIGDRAIDILINNAGIIGPKRQSSRDMDFDGWTETFAVNTLGPFRVTHALLPALKRSGRPRIVTVSSRMGSFSSRPTDRIAYRSSKAAVNKAMQALADDLRPEGISVVVVHPGWVRTDIGGGSADLSIAESRNGLVAVIDRLDISATGRFLNYDGSEITW